jgi:putative NADH-flavin reductase
MMKKIALIGASGFIGAAILNEALERGIKVTAIVRNAQNIILKNDNLIIEKCDIFQTDKLSSLLKGADAVISSYNPGWKNPDIARDTLTGYSSILEAVKKSGIERLQVVGGAGSLLIAPGKRLMDTDAFPKEFLPIVESLAKVLTDFLIPEKELDWVFFSPAGIIEPGQQTGKYRLGKNELITDATGNSKISVQDYAKAMIDEFENPQHHRERFTIGY